jgi:acyl-coenzyme A synthetase/AMP-(fatty) acid ligase
VPAYQRPARYLLVHALPRDANGKLQRVRLSSLMTAQ